MIVIIVVLFSFMLTEYGFSETGEQDCNFVLAGGSFDLGMKFILDGSDYDDMWVHFDSDKQD